MGHHKDRYRCAVVNKYWCMHFIGAPTFNNLYTGLNVCIIVIATIIIILFLFCDVVSLLYCWVQSS